MADSLVLNMVAQTGFVAVVAMADRWGLYLVEEMDDFGVVRMAIWRVAYWAFHLAA